MRYTKLNRATGLLSVALLAAVAVVVTLVEAPASEPALSEISGPLSETNVFVSGTGGYHTYRIPALTISSHGVLLAFAEGRKSSSSDTGDVDLLLKRSADQGKTWENARVIWDDGSNTCGNPCPVVDRQTGTIWLLMTWNRGRNGYRRYGVAPAERERRRRFPGRPRRCRAIRLPTNFKTPVP